jgi:hypothetical protein
LHISLFFGALKRAGCCLKARDQICCGCSPTDQGENKHFYEARRYADAHRIPRSNVAVTMNHALQIQG